MGTAWFTTAYFVDPLVICNGGRSSSDWESHGTGDRLLIQSGTTDNLVSIPLTQAEADMTSDWYDHFCFVGMGDHYLQFDYTPDQACDSVLPFQILYDQGVITGFVWQHIGTLPGDKWEHPDANAVAAIIDRFPFSTVVNLSKISLKELIFPKHLQASQLHRRPLGV